MNENLKNLRLAAATAPLAPGDEAELRRPGPHAQPLPVLIAAVCFMANGKFRYEVVWWNDEVRREVWVDAFELTAVGGPA